MASRNIVNHLSTLCLILVWTNQRQIARNKKSAFYHHATRNAIWLGHTKNRIHDNFKLMIIDNLATSNNPVIYKWCWNHHLLPFMLSFNIHWMVRGASSWWSRTKIHSFRHLFSFIHSQTHPGSLCYKTVNLCENYIILLCIWWVEKNVALNAYFIYKLFWELYYR